MVAKRKFELSGSILFDYDEHGEWWRAVCKESFSPVLGDKPIDGPLRALHFIKHAER